MFEPETLLIIFRIELMDRETEKAKIMDEYFSISNNNLGFWACVKYLGVVVLTFEFLTLRVLLIQCCGVQFVVCLMCFVGCNCTVGSLS